MGKWATKGCGVEASTCPRCKGLKSYDADTCLTCRKELRKARAKFHADKGEVKGRPATQGQGRWSGVGEPGSPAALAAIEMAKKVMNWKPTKKPTICLQGSSYEAFWERG